MNTKFNDLKKCINHSIGHIEHNFTNFAIDGLKEALLKIDSLQEKSDRNVISKEYYMAVTAIITEKYGSEGFEAFCLGMFLVSKGQGGKHDLTSEVRKLLCPQLEDNENTNPGQ
jgi:hypothetical protein